MTDAIEPISLPISGSEVLRIAPSRAGKPVASYLRFWSQRSDVFVIVHMGGHLGKISIHESGQIHMRLENGKDMQKFSPLMQIDGSGWKHALEIRYLLADPMFSPPKKELGKNRWILVDAPEGKILILNLLVSDSGHPVLPRVFDGARLIWSSTLKNRRTVALIGRLVERSEEHWEVLRRYRNSADTPRFTFEKTPAKDPDIELWQHHWGPGGNILMAIPMGAEAVLVSGGLESGKTESIHMEVPGVDVVLNAPNGDSVARFRIDQTRSTFSLRAGNPEIHDVAKIVLQADFAKLIAGEKFEMASVEVPFNVQIEGIRSKTMKLLLKMKYENDEVTVRVLGASTSIQPKDESDAVSSLRVGSELAMMLPVDTLHVWHRRGSEPMETPMRGKLHLRAIPQINSAIGKKSAL
jgi:hypothetical protein